MSVNFSSTQIMITNPRPPSVFFRTEEIITHVSFFISTIASFICIVIFGHKDVHSHHFYHITGYISRQVVPIIGVISLLYNFPTQFDRIIVGDRTVFLPVSNTTLVSYRFQRTEFGDSETSATISTVLAVVRIALVMGVLLIMNILTIFSFKKYLAKKKLMVKTTSKKNLYFVCKTKHFIKSDLS